MTDQTPDTRPGLYYVTVRRSDGAWRFLAGPFKDDHARALSYVEPARLLAYADPAAPWYQFGTARIPEIENAPRGLFNVDLGIDPPAGTIH